MRTDKNGQRTRSRVFPWLLSSLLLLSVLMVPGCRTPPRPPPPKAKILTEIPTYQTTRANWNTSAACMIYKSFGAEAHPAIVGVTAALKEVLTKNGYTVVEPDTYMTAQKRRSVDRVIRVNQYVHRNTQFGGRVVQDCLVEFVVETPLLNPLVEGEGLRRHFEVWARKEGGAPYREVAENALRIDGFREALEP